MVLVEQNPVVVHTSGVSPSSRMLPVLAHTTMSSRNMSSFLAILLQPGRHGARALALERSTRKKEFAQNARRELNAKRSPILRELQTLKYHLAVHMNWAAFVYI
jgi:hypothetical protein